MKLYELIEGHKARCLICGKEIYWAGTNGRYATLSHARKHCREGIAKEIHRPSARCYQGYDVDFIIIEVKSK